jgi:hypothetical protein
MKRMRRERVTAIEVRPSVFRAYNRWIQRSMKGTAWVVSNNYYKAATGKIVTQWPHGALLYQFLTNVSGRLSSTARTARSAGSAGEPAVPTPDERASEPSSAA